jgi:hypothetical protein
LAQWKLSIWLSLVAAVAAAAAVIEGVAAAALAVI